MEAFETARGARRPGTAGSQESSLDGGEAVDAPGAPGGETANRRVGRRGLLTGAMAIAATAAVAAIGRPAGVVAAAQLPDDPGFWLRVNDAWIQTEKQTSQALQMLVDQRETEVRLKFRVGGPPLPVWAWHVALDEDRVDPKLPIYAVYANGNPPRTFIFEQAELVEVSVRTETDGDDALLVTDLTIQGSRLRRPTKAEEAIFSGA